MRETGGGGPRRELLARLDRNAERLEQIYKRLSEEGFAETAETPSEEWLRDNHYVVRAQLLEIRRNLPRKYYEELPDADQRPLAALPARLRVRAGFRRPTRPDASIRNRCAVLPMRTRT